MAIEKMRVADLVVDDFEKRIRTGKLKKGDKLPNEIEYARQLGISRLSLREGIQIMRAMGAVIQRPKLGTVVVCDNPDLWIRFPSTRNIMEEGLLSQLTDVRVLIESYMARLFAENAAESFIHSLREKADEQIELSEHLHGPEDYDRYVECDMEFHMIIANGSGNRYLAMIFSSVLQNIRAFAYETFYRHRDSVGRANDMHLNIYEALRRRDGDLAAALMTEHIKEATGYSLPGSEQQQ
ncbi:MAG: FadR family transcriptional regulator [Ruminococcaceae bacterium]|nr:FadR family transcriptional regulator [Oscillospiraceae bacterium]